MRALSRAEILAVWETGAGQHPLSRAMTMLAAACQGHRWADLACLSIGQRDRLLWELHEKTFGPETVGLKPPASN